MIRIAIADDHPIVRNGLREIVRRAPDMSVTAEAESGRELLDRVKHNSIDVVILDISMPGKDGLEVLTLLKERMPRVKVLILSIHPENHYGARAFENGASGYLAKKSIPEELLKAIRVVASGESYMSPLIAEQLARKNKPPHSRLSYREMQIISLLASGKKATQIAAELDLSVKTISTFRSRALKKLDLKDNDALIRYARKHQLLTSS